jgi:MFS family permease
MTPAGSGPARDEDRVVSEPPAEQPRDPAVSPAVEPVKRRLLVDISPLRRFPRFRLLWTGYLVSTIGSQLTVVAVPLQVFDMTHSSLDVGLLSLAVLGPLLVGSIVGGSVADAVDRRRMLFVTETAMAAASVGLALNASSRHPALWPVFVLTAFSGMFAGADSPTRTAMVANLVDRRSYAAANALWQLLFQVAQVGGPAIAGLMISRIGIAVVYWVDAATFGTALLSVFLLGRVQVTSARTTFGMRSIVEGFAYLRGRRVLQSVFIVDLDAMIFGLPRALFPALGLVRFHGGATAVGLLYSAPGAGALVGAFLTGWVANVRRQGRAVMIAVGIWGVAIVVFGFSHWLPLALSMLAVAGAADVLSAVFRSTILQLSVPDSLRGRLSAINIAVVTGGPRLGDAEAGGVAALAGVQFSVVSGGLACLVGLAIIAVLIPQFSHYDVADHLEAPQEPEGLQAREGPKRPPEPQDKSGGGPEAPGDPTPDSGSAS